MTEPIEKREQLRMNVTGYLADIADGNFVYTGVVQDVSFKGLRLHDLPNRFSLNGTMLKVVVSDELHSDHYKLTVTPQWRRKSGVSQEVGFNIVDAPDSWKKFIQRIIPAGDIPPEGNEEKREEVWNQ